MIQTKDEVGSSSTDSITFNSYRSIFRSCKMSFVQLYIPAEGVQIVVSEIGDLGIIQFKDLNSDVSLFQRAFTGNIRKLDEMERKIRFLLEQAEKGECISPVVLMRPKPSILALRQQSRPNELSALDNKLSTYEERIKVMTRNQEELEARYIGLIEYQSVLHASAVFLKDFNPSSSRWKKKKKTDKDGRKREITLGEESERTATAEESENDRNGEMVTTLAEDDDNDNDSFDEEEQGKSSSSVVSFIAGAIERRKLQPFERVLWRALRGNVYIKSVDLMIPTTSHSSHPSAFYPFASSTSPSNPSLGSSFGHQYMSFFPSQSSPSTLISPSTTVAPSSSSNSSSPSDGQGERKSAFIAFVHGKETLMRAKKICQVLGCTLYDIDPELSKRHQMEVEMAAKVDDLRAILFSTRQAKRAELVKVAENLYDWLLLVRRQKAILDTMNRFAFDSDVAVRKGYVAEGWCPTDKISHLDNALKSLADIEGFGVAPLVSTLSIPYGQTPPTYFPLNKFTMGFQEINDSYGIPKYGEMNPATFSIITFPFLFALMFGDLGHGMLILIAAGLLCFYEKKINAMKSKGEIFKMFFGGRYILLLMGLFSVYVGFIYNDCFSRTISLFPSQFTIPSPADGSHSSSDQQAIIRQPGYVYPFGLDPIWAHSKNGMTFLNSYKMKQSILIGLVHMSFGIILGAFNMFYFGEKINVFCTVLPQLLFMSCLFGYLGFLIVYKWATGIDFSILNTFITMILRLGAVDGPTTIYANQKIIQKCLIVLAFSCIPWMLAVKPIYSYWERRKIHGEGYSEASNSSSSSNNNNFDSFNGEEDANMMKGGYDRKGERRGKDDTDHDDRMEERVKERKYSHHHRISNSSQSSVASKQKKVLRDEEHGGVGHSLGDIVIHQMIHTIEFVLSSVSNTASYLRLWALSLAHVQLSDVLWKMMIEDVKSFSYFLLVMTIPVWMAFTVAILVMMEGMSAFLHALRLHWVEFNNKFYGGTGVKFEPFDLSKLEEED